MRVVLLDTQTTFRESFRIALRQEGIEVLVDDDAARRIYDALPTARPDLIVSEFFLSDTDVVSVVHELGRREIGIHVMALTAQDNGLFVREALRGGVRGYALKNEPLANVIDGMRRVLAGECYVSPTLGKLAAARPSLSRSALRLENLSAREREVFFRIVQGESSQKIAGALCISLKTVETHRLHINRKLGVHSPMELLRLAAMTGFLPPDAASAAGNGDTAPREGGPPGRETAPGQD